jgi:hypothetical protein
MDKKITEIDQEIEKKIVDERQKDYGDYQKTLLCWQRCLLSS